MPPANNSTNAARLRVRVAAQDVAALDAVIAKTTENLNNAESTLIQWQAARDKWAKELAEQQARLKELEAKLDLATSEMANVANSGAGG